MAIIIKKRGGASRGGALEIGRYDHPARALNAAIAAKMRSPATWRARIEEVPSRSRSGHMSWIALLEPADFPRQTLELLESWYVNPANARRTTSNRRSSKRRSSKRRTSRRRNIR
jgi:hypothetical protein